MKTVSTLVGLAALASAITITQPAVGAQWDFSQTNTIEWTSVSTDPTSFDIVLVNHDASPATEFTLQDPVNTSDGKFSFTNFVAPAGDQYTIKFFTNSTVTSQLAESQQFNVTKSGVAPTTTSPSGPSSTSSAGAAATTSKSAATTGKALGVVGGLALLVAAFL